jgi:hypothetical protein
VAGLVALAALALAVLWLWPSRVSRANFDRIQLGAMTRADVEALPGPSNCSLPELDGLNLDGFDGDARAAES